MTQKMPALFKANPPRRPLTCLDAIVDDWIWRFGKGGKSAHMRDEVVDWCAKARTAKEAVYRATNSQRPNGKCHNHQSRVLKKNRDRLAALILTTEAWRAKDFDTLHDNIAGIIISGIGPVTIYDVATRIAAWRKLEITSLYLHAGVRTGWCLLHGQRSPAVERIPREALPPALQRLPTDEVEDMLCAYRDYLKPWLAKGGAHAQA